MCEDLGLFPFFSFFLLSSFFNYLEIFLMGILGRDIHTINSFFKLKVCLETSNEGVVQGSSLVGFIYFFYQTI